MNLIKVISSRSFENEFFIVGATLMMFMLTVGVVRAQTGSIQGTVVDQKDRTLPGASVVVQNPNTGLRRGTTTDSDGEYRFLSLPPGTYQIEVSFTGYQTVRKKGIRLRIDQTLRVDFQLQKKTVELKEVQVVSKTQAIQMDNPAVATPITAAQIENQPTFSRNLMELGKLVPGGRSRGGGAAEFGSGLSQPGIQTPTGAVFGDFVIDGVSWKDRSAGAPLTGSKDNAFLSQEAVQEMRFITNGYDAKYRGGTAVTVIETRRGSNTFEGSFFTNGFTSDLRSKGPFEESVPSANRFQWGGYLSGPILEDKLFFNVAYEEEEDEEPVSYSPGSDVWSEFAGTRTFTEGSRLLSAGLTARPSQAHTIELTSHFWRSGHPNHLGGAVTEDWGWTRDQKMSVYQLRHLYTPNSDISNDFSLVHQRRQWFTKNLSDEVTRVYPGITQGPLNFLWPLKQNDNITKATNHFTYALDNHTFKAGGTLGYSDLREWWPRLRTPALIYGVDDPSADPIIAQVGIGRNVLKGDASDPTNTESAEIKNPAWLLSFYAQDDWDVTSGLTLSLGLRWSASPGHLNNDFAMPEDFAKKLRDAGVPERYIAEGNRNDDLNNFAPRIRFSWDIFGEGKTTINGGYARSYDRPPSNDVDREQRDANWLIHTIIFNNAPFLPDDVRPLFPDPTENPQEIRQLVLEGEANLQPNLTLLAKNVEYPETDDYSIGINHQFTPNIRASLDFVAKNTRHGFGTWNFNPQQGGSRAKTPEFGDVLLSDDFWDRQYRAMLFSVRREYRDDWMLQFNYALSETNTDVMRPHSPDPFDGVSGSGDERHRFTLNGIYNLPWGFRISGYATLASPTPFNATDGRDLNQDGSFENDYLGGKPFNFRPSGFDAWYRKVDLRLSKSFTYRGISAQLRVEAFNVLNTDNYSDYFTRRRNAQGEKLSRFGEPVAAYSPRRIQLGVRMSF